MTLKFGIQKKEGKNTSKLSTKVNITNDGKAISYKTINKFYRHLLDEGWEQNQIYIKVLNPQRQITVKNTQEHYATLKNLQEDLYATLEEYYVNKVKDPKKFYEFTEVIFGILE